MSCKEVLFILEDIKIEVVYDCVIVYWVGIYFDNFFFK